jgi:hypothetical protein
MVSNGILNKWLTEMYWTASHSTHSQVKSCIYDTTKQNFTDSITFNNIKTLIYLVFIANLISIFLFFCEILFFNFITIFNKNHFIRIKAIFCIKL